MEGIQPYNYNGRYANDVLRSEPAFSPHLRILLWVAVDRLGGLPIIRDDNHRGVAADFVVGHEHGQVRQEDGPAHREGKGTARRGMVCKIGKAGHGTHGSNSNVERCAAVPHCCSALASGENNNTLTLNNPSRATLGQ